MVFILLTLNLMTLTTIPHAEQQPKKIKYSKQ
jgi:hypothetical protein